MKLFSKLNRSKTHDNITYDLPDGLRTQIVMIWEKGLGPNDRYTSAPRIVYEKVYDTLCMEHQLPALPCLTRDGLTHQIAIEEYFTRLEYTSKALDVVQIMFSTIESTVHRRPNAFGDDMFMFAPRTDET